MDKRLKKIGFVILFLAGLASYLFFFRLGAMALTDPDESFYGQTAKEMLNRHEWSTPYLYDKPQFEKPILFYWLVEASYKVFGVNEFAARFPSAVFAFFGIVAIYFLGALLFNKRVGLLSAVILATNVEYIILSRACVTDMVLAVFMLLGALFFMLGYLRQKSYFYILSAAAFALATLTKGPIAIILSGAVIVLYLFMVGDLKAVKRMPLLRMAIIFIAIAAPWFFLMYRLHGKQFIDVFFGFHNVTRFLQSEHKIGSQVYYNIPVVFGGFFPWSIFLPLGFWRFWRMFRKGKGTEIKGQYEKKSSAFILLWFAAIFLFFSASSTKLPTYIFPSFISLAVIAAVVWDEFLRSKISGGANRAFSISYYLLFAVTIIGSIVAPVVIGLKYRDFVPGVTIAVLFLIVGMSLSLAAFISKRFIASFFLIAASVAVFLYPLDVFVVPNIERYETSKEIALKLKTMMKPSERLGAESNYVPGLAFYTDKIPVDMDIHDTWVRFVNSDQRVWCVVKEKNFRDLYQLKREKPVYTKPSYMVYKVGKRAIITNAEPEDGVYIIKRELEK